jgi:hypothetical protein
MVLRVATVRAGTRDLGRVVHLVAGREVRDPRSDLLDDAGDVRAEDYRRLEPARAAGGAELGIYGVRAGGDDPDKDLTRPGPGHLDVPLLEEIRRPELRCDHGSHAMPSPREDRVIS